MLVLFAFVFVANLSLKAQLGYQIRWYSNGVTYEGLLWEKGDNIWDLRVMYDAGGLHIIQETLVRGIYEGIPCLVGTDVKFTCYTNPNARYSADHFIIDVEKDKIYTFDANSTGFTRVKIIEDGIHSYSRFSYLVRVKYGCNTD